MGLYWACKNTPHAGAVLLSGPNWAHEISLFMSDRIIRATTFSRYSSVELHYKQKPKRLLLKETIFNHYFHLLAMLWMCYLPTGERDKTPPKPTMSFWGTNEPWSNSKSKKGFLPSLFAPCPLSNAHEVVLTQSFLSLTLVDWVASGWVAWYEAGHPFSYSVY